MCKLVGWGGVQFAAKTTDAMVRFKSMYTDYFFWEVKYYFKFMNLSIFLFESVQDIVRCKI